MSYGCYNKTRPTADTETFVPSGFRYHTGENRNEFVRLTRLVKIKHVMSIDCQYTKTTRDIQCSGCIHQETKHETQI